MDGKYYSLIEMGFTALVVFGIAIWQIVSVNREIARDKKLTDSDLPEGPGHPVGEHRLDDR